MADSNNPVWGSFYEENDRPENFCPYTQCPEAKLRDKEVHILTAWAENCLAQKVMRGIFA